uniref:Uncharacterized protein n=1 Tax=Arundo donax TaxID=35708 RepID=A0A0A8YB40_ARUDO
MHYLNDGLWKVLCFPVSPSLSSSSNSKNFEFSHFSVVIEAWQVDLLPYTVEL